MTTSQYGRAPKQWSLTRTETITSFKAWRNNLTYTLSLDPNFAPFIDTSWEKKSKSKPVRGFTDDPTSSNPRLTAVQKNNFVELMLGQVANFCPIIARNSIIKGATSLSSIWQMIRLHFGFQTSGSHFLDLNDIKLETDERFEDLYQRIFAFVEDSLLTPDSQISHHDQKISEEEEMTPTLENFIVLTWLRLINTDLPRLVKQRYGPELRSRTLASLKPEISQALNSLIDELENHNPAAMRTSIGQNQRFRPKSKTVSRKVCPICKEASRPSSHFLSQCKYLPEEDKKFMIRARQITDILDLEITDEPENVYMQEDNSHELPTTANRVQTSRSPYLDVFVHDNPVRLTIDSGATGNMIRHSTATRIGAKIKDSNQSANQADGSSHLSDI